MATLYAKAAGGNWSAASTWSNVSSAGGDSSGPPTTADDVIFETGSGNVTIDINSACRSLDCTSGTGDYGGVLTHSDSTLLNMGDATAGTGNVILKFSNAMTYTLGVNKSAQVLLRTTAATPQVVDTKGKTMPNTVTFGSGSVTGSYQLTSALNTNSTGTVTLTQGTLDTNGQTLSLGNFNSNNTNTRTLTITNSAITITGAGTSWQSQNSSGMTLNAASSTITCSGAAVTFRGGNTAVTYGTVIFSGSGIVTMGDNNATNPTYTNLTRTGTTAKTDSISWGHSSVTITNTFTATGNSLTNRLLVQANTLGAATTITAGAISLTNADFQDITGAGLPGNAAWTGTSLGDALGNSNITFTVNAGTSNGGNGVNRYWVATTGGNWSNTTSWSTSDGGASGATVPLAQDDVFFTANSITSTGRTITGDMPRKGRHVNFSAIANNPTLAPNLDSTFYGNLTLGAMTADAAVINWVLRGRGSQTLTTNGMRLGLGWRPQVASGGGTYTLQDNLTFAPASGATSSSVTASAGTFDTNSKTVTVCQFTCTGGTFNLGSSNIILNCNRDAISIVNVTSGTVNASSATFTISPGSAVATMTFAPNGTTFGTVTYDSNSTATLTVTGANTYNRLLIGGSAKTINLSPNVTQTIQTSFTSVGISTKVLTIKSNVGGTAATIALGSSGTWVSSYNSIQDITVTGTRTPVLAYHGTNVSGNTGFDFTTKRPSATTHTSATTRSLSATRTVASARTGAS